MKYVDPVFEGLFLKRYKRFFADIELEGKTITAHVANTGSLRTCLSNGAPCRVTFNDDPKRKLKYSLQQIKTPGSWVGVNTQHANSLAWEAWEKKILTSWEGFDHAQREVKISAETRFDLALFKANKLKRYVEIKNVTMAENNVAMFPDAETTRGQKHLRELTSLRKSGVETELLFVVQRSDCTAFRPAQEIDKVYADLLKMAASAGVIVSCYAADLYTDRIELNPNKKIAIQL